MMYRVSRYTSLSASAAKSISLIARSTASEISSCSVAVRGESDHLVVPQPAMNAHRALRISDIALVNVDRFMGAGVELRTARTATLRREPSAAGARGRYYSPTAGTHKPLLMGS